MRSEQEIEDLLRYFEEKEREYESTMFEDRPKGWSSAVDDLLASINSRIVVLRWVLNRNTQRGADGVWTNVG